MVIKGRACQASAIPATVLITNVVRTIQYTKDSDFCQGVSVGARCADLAWADLLCAHQASGEQSVGSGALIWASGLHMLGEGPEMLWNGLSQAER